MSDLSRLLPQVQAVSGGAVTKTVAIANADATGLSTAIDLTDLILLYIAMPPAWTAADLTVALSFDQGSNYGPRKDNAGNEYTIKAAAGDVVTLPLSDYVGEAFLKLRSGTKASPVAQGADRILALVALR